MTICLLVQFGLHSLEQVAVENGLLFAPEDLALEGHLADVEATTQEVGERPAGEGNAANGLAGLQGARTCAPVAPGPRKGAIDWPGGGLDLQGIVRPDATGAPVVEIVGTGRRGTGTEGWEYDYHGQLAYQWPNGVNQVPALVGSVIRAKPHDGAPAGYVASFIAVKQP
jgi:hypothetical protein